ncbi:MAG: multidrug effflux MFS transporter [Pseudomonadota bacterium]
MLVAFLISIGAMGTDLMLPALDAIGRDLSVANPNNTHFIVTAFFLGMAVGQLVVGPLSDSIGRKPAIILGYGVFLCGCFLSMFAENWALMLIGRVLQGLGAAAPRIVTIALVRDEYEGRAMARIMSIAMSIFILVPILAPAVGQGLIYLGGWRMTFAGLAVLAIVATVWFGLRQPETLPVSGRRPFRGVFIWNGIREILRTRVALGYTIATGCMYGVFVGYLGSAQRIFTVTFGVGDLFALYFALSAASIGIAAMVNARLVMGLGMHRLNGYALIGLTLLSFGFWAVLPIFDGVPPLSVFLTWQLANFFCVGIVFGNLNALALEPLGHMAGLGAAFVGSIATFMSLPLAWAIGHLFDGTVFPLVAGFATLGLATCCVVVWTDRGSAALRS